MWLDCVPNAHAKKYSLCILSVPSSEMALNSDTQQNHMDISQSQSPVVLEICCGTASFSTAARTRGYTAVTVDIDPAFNPTHTCDVRDWDHTAYAPGHFTHVWCSPPCTAFSNAKRSGERDYATADSIVLRCLELIAYFKPAAWFIENPASGYLKTRPYMAPLPYHKLDYCAYDPTLGRRKRTAIWTNVSGFVPRLCAGEGKCPSMVGASHRGTCTGSYWEPIWKSKRGRAIECGRVPHDLIHALLNASHTTAT